MAICKNNLQIASVFFYCSLLMLTADVPLQGLLYSPLLVRLFLEPLQYFHVKNFIEFKTNTNRMFIVRRGLL